MKTYVSNVEGLLMHSPAVFLHKGQRLDVEEDTVEIFHAIKDGKLREVRTAMMESKKSEAQNSEEKEEQETMKTKPEKTSKSKSEKPAKEAPPAFL